MTRASQQTTSLTLRELTSDAVWRLLASPRGRAACTADAIPGLPDLRSMHRERLQVAIADLVHDGALEESPTGALVVQPHPAQEPA